MLARTPLLSGEKTHVKGVRARDSSDLLGTAIESRCNAVRRVVPSAIFFYLKMQILLMLGSWMSSPVTHYPSITITTSN